jgi:hypothetical protein
MRAMTPISTPSEMHTGIDVVAPIVVVVIIVVIVAVALRGALMGAVDEVADLVRTYGPVASRRALDHRPGLPATPWFCARCSSANGLSATICYRCGGRRDECEAPVPDAELPAGPSAGLAQRNRSRG